MGGDFGGAEMTLSIVGQGFPPCWRAYFLLLRQKKVAKEKATPVRRPFGVPCVARLVRPPHKLARPATRSRAQTYSSDYP